MKKKLFFLMPALAGIISATAQVNTIQLEDSSYLTTQRWQDTCFGLIDKTASQIPSGLLIDYSLAGLNDSLYNSHLGSNLDTIDDAGKLFYLNAVFSSSVVNSNASITSTDSLYINAYRYTRDNNSIPLLFLFQAYQKINPTALTQGLFTVTPDSIRLLDVAGRQFSPYINDYAFAFSPFLNVISQFNSINFSLPSQFWMMPGVSSVQIDFDDGAGFRTLSPGNTISIYYPASGTYYLTAIISTTAGQFTAKSIIHYTQPPVFMRVDTSFSVTVTPLYTGISNYITSNGGSLKQEGTPIPCSDDGFASELNCDINPGANVTITKGCDNLFDKPIIVVIGFDPTNSFTSSDLIKDISYTYTASNENFYTTMQAAGYDFVFVTFTKNGDLIENNAMVLEQVIEKINTLKSGNNKSSIIGISMGGLIVRWALKDMEDNGIDHEVANYFSYDSPHQGANIPLGLQYMVNEIIHDFQYTKYFKSYKDQLTALTSPAAQQMLVTYASYNNGPFDWSPNLYTLNQVRSIFAQKLIDKGYPQNCTRFGISLGRGNNTNGTTDASVGDQFGFGPGSSLFHTEFVKVLQNLSTTVYAVNINNTNDYICRYRYLGRKVINLFGIHLSGNFVVRVRNFKYTGQYPYDNGPGAYDNDITEITDDVANSLTNTTNYNHFGFCFIPVASALDLQNQGYGSTDQYQSNNQLYAIDNNLVNQAQVGGNTLNNSSLSPFQHILTYTSDCNSGISCEDYDKDALVQKYGISDPSYNDWNQHHEAYMSYQTELFVERSILNSANLTACNGYADFCNKPFGILGPNIICSGTATYQLINNYMAFNNVNIQWSISGNGLNIINGQGTGNITVQYVNNGTAQINAVVTNSCGIQAYPDPIEVQVGLNTPSFVVNALNYCQGTHFTAIATSNNPGQSISSYNWFVDGSPQSYTGFKLTGTFPSDNNYMELSVSSTNCGTSDIYYVPDLNCSGGYDFIVAPNPASNTVTITTANTGTTDTTTNTASRNSVVSKATVPAAKAIIRQVKIVDVGGRLMKQMDYSTPQQQVIIDVAGLQPGIYFVSISDGKSMSYKKMVIQR